MGPRPKDNGDMMINIIEGVGDFFFREIALNQHRTSSIFSENIYLAGYRDLKLQTGRQKDIYKASLKSATNSDHQFSIFIASDKRPYYFILYRTSGNASEVLEIIPD